jgi:hypothetical protein
MSVVLIAALAGCNSNGTQARGRASRSPAAAHPAGYVPARRAFLTVANGLPNAGETLQLRSVSHGAVIRTLVQTKPHTIVSAAQASDGGVVAALTTGCESVLERIDSGTSRATALRKVGETVSGIALSPTGTQIAYLTHPSCVVDHCTGKCAGPAAFLPNVLVVLNLLTGSRSRAATDDQGHPLFGLSWSPDGRQIVAGYDGDRQQLVIFDAGDLNFPAAHRVPNPSGCSYFAPAWTLAGLVAAQGCGPEPDLSPSRIVQINAQGVVSAQWALPSCIDGLTTRTDPAHERILVQSNIGYGSGMCATRRDAQISRVIDGQLHTVIDLLDSDDRVQLDG